MQVCNSLSCGSTDLDLSKALNGNPGLGFWCKKCHNKYPNISKSVFKPNPDFMPEGTMFKLETTLGYNSELDSISCDKIPNNTAFTGSFSYDAPDHLYIKLPKYQKCIAITPIEFNIYLFEEGKFVLCNEKANEFAYNKFLRYKPVNMVMSLEKSNK